MPGTRKRQSPTFDLQSHSHHSDGALPAGEVVARAVSQGVKLLALTDHDTVDGIPEALAAARHHGLTLSPAAELSAVHDDAEDLHVLGYELDHADATLQERLRDWRGDRQRRIEQMADRLEELGFDLDRAELEQRKREGRPLGRPHLARALLEGNADRLEDDEGITTLDELFAAYLVPGARAYVARTRPTVPEAIEAIHDANGVAVWAHPFWDFADAEKVVATLEAFTAGGLDGVEAFYATHTEEQTYLLHDEAVARGLYTTGSADFHGPEHGRFHAFRAFELHGLEPDLGPIGETRAT